MNAPKWWLRWRLKHAARLLKKGVLNRSQYSAIAVKFGYGILRKPLQYDTFLDQYPFSLALGNALGLPPSHSESEYRDLLDAYGPFNEAVVSFRTSGQLHVEAIGGKPEPLVWNEQLEGTYKAAALQLSAIRRLVFRLQDWWKEQERIFPSVSNGVKYLVTLVVGALIGHCIK